MPRAIRVRTADSITPEIDAFHHQVRQRAYELSCANGSHDPSDNWLRAERDLSWRPAVELRRKDDEFVVIAAVAGLEPEQVEVAVTPTDVLVQGETGHLHTGDDGEVHLCEFHRGRLFRSVHFPQPIEPDLAKVELKNGLLRITAPLAGAGRTETPAEKPKPARKRKS